MSVPLDYELLVATYATDGTALRCNSAWTSVLGTQDAPWRHLSAEDQEMAMTSVLDAASGALVTNQVVSADTSHRDEPLPVLLHFIPVHDSAKDVADVHAVTVTGEVMAEPSTWTISQTQRHRLEALGRMTMGVAHDLNNLLSGLIGHAQLMQERARKEAFEEAPLRSVATIVQAAEDGATLIRKLQGYIRQDTQVHFEPVDLPSLVEDCITLTQPYWLNEPRRKGIRISVNRRLQPVPPVMGSAAELRDVLVNLTLNAVQAMPNGGDLVYETFVNDQQQACIRVSDTGEGMSESVQERIFEPLFTTKGEHGTGMGLSASYGIIQEHGGTINVESTTGEGTTFTVALPPSSANTSPLPKETPQTTVSDHVRVLIVDDEEMVRSVLEQLLSLKGHEVSQAASGKEALASVAENPVDIVFTDFGMPEMTGGELALRLRSHQPDLPIVLLTGYTDPNTAPDAVDAVLHKPFKLEELESVIQQMLRQ